MPYYVIHVVKHHKPQFHEKSEGRWLYAVYDDPLIARQKAEQLNERLHLTKHHHYLVCNSLADIDGLSVLAAPSGIKLYLTEE